MKQIRRWPILSALLLMLGASAAAGSASAQTTFDVIGPHEYELPVDFESFNAFVQYGIFQDNDRAFNANGDRIDGAGSEVFTGLSKYVHFWTPESNKRIGMAWEVIVPEVAIRHAATVAGDRHISGIGDPMAGFAIWYKPNSRATLGFQSFVQVPIGADRVSDTNWKNLSSFFWDWRISENFGWTGDAGIVWQGRRDDRTRPGLTWHTNHRFGYRASEYLEPFIGLDAERTDGRNGLPEGWTLDGGAGLMIQASGNQSITVRYSSSLDGKNRGVNDSFNLKYACTW